MPKTKARVLELALGTREAQIRASDVKERKAKMTFSTGSRVMRFDWDFGSYWEELSMDPANVRLDRVKDGSVPFLKNHGSRWDGPKIEDVMGNVTSASVDGTRGEAEVRFSKREDIAPFVQDIVDEILRSVSVGYRIHTMEKVGEEDGVPILRAIDWEVFEISSVAMPADSSAGFRSLNATEQEEHKKKIQRFQCEVRGIEEQREKPDPKGPVENALARGKNTPQDQSTGEITMTEAEKRAHEEKLAAEKAAIEKLAAEKRAADDKEAARAEGIKAERERQKDIRHAVRAAKLSDEFADKLIGDEKMTADQARTAVIDELAKGDKSQVTRSVSIVTPGGQDEVDNRRGAMVDAIMHRGDPLVHKMTERGREWSGMTLLEMARESLRLQGVRVAGMDRLALAARALHSTSDFPAVTADIINKTLRASFQASPQTFAPFTRRVQNPDFKQISRVQLGMGTALEEVGEDGLIRAGTVSDTSEKYQLKEYAKKIGISRKTIINDDLEAFVRLPSQMGVKARSLESDLVYAVLTANAVLTSDGLALFVAGHGNLAGAGSVISIASLAAGRSSVRAQKEIDGEPLNLPVRTLIVPTELETIAEQFISVIQPQTSGSVNPFAAGGRTPLGLVVEPRLSANSATAWYMASALDQVDIVELATLSGTTEPEVLMEELFDSLGMQFRVVHSVAAKAIDYRGLYKNPGA